MSAEIGAISNLARVIHRCPATQHGVELRHLSDYAAATTIENRTDLPKKAGGAVTDDSYGKGPRNGTQRLMPLLRPPWKNRRETAVTDDSSGKRGPQWKNCQKKIEHNRGGQRKRADAAVGGKGRSGWRRKRVGARSAVIPRERTAFFAVTAVITKYLCSATLITEAPPYAEGAKGRADLIIQIHELGRARRCARLHRSRVPCY